MTDRLNALRLFVRAGRVGNFSSAGREFGLSQPTTSRLIAALEETIGATLFNRTTRAVSLTEAGERYMMRIETILAALDEAQHEARGSGELRGVLRVGAPSTFLLRAIVPNLHRFLAKHPGLRVELLSSDRLPDLVTEGIDIAFRLGPLPDSSAITRKIMQTRRVLVAAPSYLAGRGTPETPAGLARHTVIMGPDHSPTLSFRKDDQTVSVRVEIPLAVTINEGMIACAVEGLGITVTSVHSVLDELERGALTQLLPDWDLGAMEVNAVFAGGRNVKPAARAFADFLQAELRPFAARTPQPGPGPEKKADSEAAA
jgi:DNA-binding transcriptional LysR family regulator